MENWKARLDIIARHDPWHQECLEEVEKFTADFERIRSGLPEADQELLDLYIAACEELEHSRTLIAHRMGR